MSVPGRAQEKPPPKLKPYDQIITEAARSQSGLFRTHRLGDKLYYEIPKAQLSKDFLLVTQVARGRLGTGNGGGDPIDTRVVRWVLREQKMLLLDIDYRIWAEPGLPVAQAVEAANNPTVLAAFPVETLGEDGAPVFEVSKLFTQDMLELSPKSRIGARQFDRERSFLEQVSSYPENLEIESTITLANDSASPGFMPRGSASLRMHYSMIKLPEQPMMPRLADSRVGYFSSAQLDYGRPDHFVDTRQYIARWRLEKKHPDQAVSEPIKPIIFYIDPATPKAWVPYIRRGVEQWQTAFEGAGFKNAIQAREVPPGEAGWSMEDARHSVIRWVASTTANAYGPHISDPRSGEILEADIHIFHNILDLQRRWYFTQVGHLDPRARHLPLPDDLMGELIEYVVAHEVGHSLGLPHNMRASSTYPLARVRDRNWVRKMGHTPSIMDYSRFNYLAQPEDGIDVADLVPKVGVYDRFAIRWGYTPIEGARSPEAERPVLDRWARQQDATPWLRFSNLDSWNIDPGDQSEAVGDEDPVQATRLGVKNLRRVQSMLLEATSEPGEDYATLAAFQRQLLGQWATEMGHVIPVVGGVVKQDKHSGQGGTIYRIIPRQRQLRALDYLLSDAFQAQPWLSDPEVVRRISISGSLDATAQVQEALLYRLLDPNRINRMAEQTATHRGQALAPSEFLNRVRASLFRELAGAGSIAYPRRLMQRSLTGLLIQLGDTRGEARGLAQQQLRVLLTELNKARNRFRDPETSAHLARLVDDIERDLDPRSPPPSANPARAQWDRPAGLDDGHGPGCWHNSQLDWLPGL